MGNMLQEEPKSAQLINDDCDHHDGKNEDKEKTSSAESVSNIESIPLFDVLKDLCLNSIEFFKNDDSVNGLRLHGAFIGLIDHIEKAKPLIKEIQLFAPEYDFDEHTPGNGYRSFIIVVDCCISYSIKLCRYVVENRNSILFRKGVYMREVEACSHLLASLCVCLDHLMTLRSWSVPGNLFTDKGHTAEELFAHGGAINQYCFYGRCLGFQFCDSMRSVLKFISSCMAGFSEGYYSDKGRIAKTTSSMWTSGKFLLDPELRARRIVNLSQNSDVHFCKAFWFLAESELMASVPSVIGTAVKINKLIKIPPEPLKLPNIKTGELIDIPIPSSHLGPGPVIARLISYNNRRGMMGERSASLRCSTSVPPAKGLILHCHGGGFVAQSSKSHELYLRDWAVALNVPILSIDYSLAPAAPFPRALEEVFYAYCWALKNCELLGTTGENIIFAGDSAGANLNLACTLKCIDMGIKKPDGILLLYCPVLISFVVSPARLLCLMDPLLPFSFMMSCLKAYTCPSDDVLEANRQRVTDLLNIARAKPHLNNNLFSMSTPSTASDNRNRTALDSDSTNKTAATVMIKKNDDDKNNITDNDDLSDHSISLNNSTWEQIPITDENDFQNGLVVSPSDTFSDTLASASLRSQTLGNTEVPTPDESNGISFEEDSQPITIHKTMINGKEVLYEFNDIPLDCLPRSVDDIHIETMKENDVPEINGSTQYVSEFIDRYILQTSTIKDGYKNYISKSLSRSHSEENVVFDIGREAISIDFLQERLQKVAEHVISKVTTPISLIKNSRKNSSSSTASLSSKDKRKDLDSLDARSPSEEFIFEVPKDPYVSPYFASDDVLKQMPPVKIVTLSLDPCLDDCVMFAKRLKNCGNAVGLDILNGLPHGFLNFTSVSKEANEGSKLCIKRIAELLGTVVPAEETKTCC